MINKNLEKMNVFRDLVAEIKCMSYYQATHIINTYMGNCRIRSESLLNDMSLNREMYWNSDKTILYASSDSVDRKIIEDVAVMLSLFDEEKKKNNNDCTSILESIPFINRPRKIFELSFISDGICYQMIHLTRSDFGKIETVRSVMEENMARLEKYKDLPESAVPCTIFVFQVDANEEAVLEMFEKMDITFPHWIVFIKTDDFTGTIPYTLYKP